nr:BrnT family toxin [uncultured Acetatifactor sp.]
MIDKENSRTIAFWLGGMLFEYDEWKNEYNVEHHGISFRQAARVFFDYDRIELYDEENSDMEDRYDTIGDLAAGHINMTQSGETIIGNAGALSDKVNDIIFVVYTERIQTGDAGKKTEVTRLISARLATDFERGLYYGKY